MDLLPRIEKRHELLAEGGRAVDVVALNAFLGVKQTMELLKMSFRCSMRGWILTTDTLYSVVYPAELLPTLHPHTLLRVFDSVA